MQNYQNVHCLHSSLREGNGAGLRTAAFFFGHQVMHLIDIFVQPAIFMSLYYTLTLPEIKFVDYYISAPHTSRICLRSWPPP